MNATAKKWLAALGIVCLLVIAFFWGGTGRDDAGKLAGNSETIRQETALPQPTIGPSGISLTASPTPSSADRTVSESSEPSAQPNSEAEIAASPAASGTESPQAADPTPAPDKKPEPDSASKPEESAAQTTNPASARPDTEAEGQKDRYLTDPVPEGKPKPVEWQDVTADKQKPLTATLAVTSKTILDHLDQFNKDKLEVLPEDGVIYKSQTVTFYEGESVFDLLLREMKNNKIHMEFSMTPIYNSNYIEGINNIYEFDCGELSGWMFKVNGWFPNYGSSRYMLKDGDAVEWMYTCDLGRDIGGDQAASGGKK